jgi:threonine/homoserine efflux transporter RhtA
MLRAIGMMLIVIGFVFLPPVMLANPIPTIFVILAIVAIFLYACYIRTKKVQESV